MYMKLRHKFVIKTTILWVVTLCSSVKPGILGEHVSSAFILEYCSACHTIFFGFFLDLLSTLKIVTYGPPEYQAFSESRRLL
jgi:hypothetical protein